MTENKMHICSAKSAKRTIVIGKKKNGKQIFIWQDRCSFTGKNR